MPTSKICKVEDELVMNEIIALNPTILGGLGRES